jgi:hypothetical protein
VTWAEAFAVLERGGRVKREAWAGHFVLVRQPELTLTTVPESHPLHGLMSGALHYGPHLLMVDTLTGRARLDVQQYADFAADDWHEVLT